MTNIGMNGNKLTEYEMRHSLSSTRVANISVQGHNELQSDPNSKPGLSVHRSTQNPSSDHTVDNIEESDRNDRGNQSNKSSNNRLEAEIPEQMVIESGYTANLNVIKAYDSMTGTLLNLLG
jgi:flagellar hook protein FlgE